MGISPFFLINDYRIPHHSSLDTKPTLIVFKNALSTASYIRKASVIIKLSELWFWVPE
jgi:hypothetical protein